MRVVIDECVPHLVEDFLRDGYELTAIRDASPEATDEAVLELANNTAALLITVDKDFGELLFLHGAQSHGVLLLRLHGLTNEQKASAVLSCLKTHEDALLGAFSVLTRTSVRIRARPDLTP